MSIDPKIIDLIADVLRFWFFETEIAQPCESGTTTGTGRAGLAGFSTKEPIGQRTDTPC